MEEKHETIGSPEWAAGESSRLLAVEKEAVQHAKDAGEIAALVDEHVGEMDEPSDEASEAAFQAEDDAMEAISNLNGAEENSRQFAETHMGSLVEAAIADATKNGVTINR